MTSPPRANDMLNTKKCVKQSSLSFASWDAVCGKVRRLPRDLARRTPALRRLLRQTIPPARLLGVALCLPLLVATPLYVSRRGKATLLVATLSHHGKEVRRLARDLTRRTPALRRLLRQTIPPARLLGVPLCLPLVVATLSHLAGMPPMTSPPRANDMLNTKKCVKQSSLSFASWDAVCGKVRRLPRDLARRTPALRRLLRQTIPPARLLGVALCLPLLVATPLYVSHRWKATLLVATLSRHRKEVRRLTRDLTRRTPALRRLLRQTIPPARLRGVPLCVPLVVATLSHRAGVPPATSAPRANGMLNTKKCVKQSSLSFASRGSVRRQA
jgi:hypothetical protein